MPAQLEPASPLSARTAWFAAFATLGLLAASASTWVHYQILHDPTYASFCDVNATFNCTDAYTSRFGAFGGVPVALLGLLFFAGTLVLIGLCSRSAAAVQNLSGYVFVVSTIGLAVVLYLAYASYVILHVVCLLCAGTYVAIIGLFLTSGATTKYPMTSLPMRIMATAACSIRKPFRSTRARASRAFAPRRRHWARSSPTSCVSPAPSRWC